MEGFADLHCHPHMRSFNYIRGTKDEKDPDLFHPWHIVLSNLRAKNKGKRASAYSQSDLIKLKNGKVKLVFASLYPIEKGWVKGTQTLSGASIITLLRNATRSELLTLIARIKSGELKALFRGIGDDKSERLSFRDFLQMLYMKIPLRRIEYLQSDHYNYFNELNLEKDFLLARNGQSTSSELIVPFWRKLFPRSRKYFRDNRNEFEASGTYKIARNGEDAAQIIQSGRIAFVTTIEGSNVFNTYSPLEEIREKITQMKCWQDIPIFFISFSHHFSNNLCGHAKSIPDIGRLVLDQSEFLNRMIEENGLEIIRQLLSIDKDGREDLSLGRRILIDVKHMSACARQMYYQTLIRPCRINRVEIPIIASHAAYSGIQRLDDLIGGTSGESDRDALGKEQNPFNTWSINLCDEDILEIFRSHGLIGVSFDQRILGIPKHNAKPDIEYFWNNLKGMMDVILQYSEPDIPDKSEVTRLFCIGTDFDGYIDPMDSYPTALEFEEFRTDLIDLLNKDNASQLGYFPGMPVTEFVDRFCIGNALDFIEKNFVS
jgi:microsomal dipeptidase-like Zn-dependent dipeptidase